VKKIPAATATTFEPRTLSLVRKQFGKVGARLQPAEHVDPLGPRFIAAQLQHRISNALREALIGEGTNLETYASNQTRSVPGMSYDRLVRVLRGETLMQLADLVTWAQQFDNVRALLLLEETWGTASTDATGEHQALEDDDGGVAG